jgi:ABC-2 type transport system permease protein
MAFLAVALMMGVGIVFYGIRPDPGTLAAAGLVFLFGAGCFAALGMLLAALASDSNTAALVGNATLFPLAFGSGLFIPPSDNTPGWLAVTGDIFPLKHFAEAFSGAFNPALSGSGFQWAAEPGTYAIGADLAVMAIWGVVAAAIAVRFFRWEPSGGGDKS